MVSSLPATKVGPHTPGDVAPIVYPSLAGRVVLITGAAGGVGRAVARAFAAQGSTVALTDVDEEGLAKAMGALDVGEVGRAKMFPADLGDVDACVKVAADVERALGPVDVLVSNAATWIAGDLADIDAEPFDRMYAVNVRAPYLLCRAILPGMAARAYGRIVVVGSVSTRDGGSPDSIAYSVTKAALPTLVRALARYAGGPDLLVNAVMPSAIETPMIGAPIDSPTTRSMDDVPVGRSSYPSEVANLILWLSSDQCSYVQGAAWDINGGRYFS
jgi:NAD(P)-dependent dehydrogenase (short-subunit alcohol dehydrogenase family)